RKRAQAAGDAAGWTRGIVLETRLRMGLHGYETAVEQLRAWDWPDDPLQRAVLELYYGDSLVQYLNAYGWEIGQRETVAGGGNDLRGWTRREIADEAARSFDAAWQRRESWGGESVGILSDYIQSGDYPAAIRGTLRDAVSYLYAELLADS